MKRTKEILELVLLGIVVTLGLLAVVLMIRWSSLWSEKAAGWAQALGSVAALAIAIWVPYRQHETDRALEAERQRLADVRRLKAVKAVLVQICSLCDGILKNVVEGNVERLHRFHPKFLAEYKPVLHGMPLFEIPSPQLVLLLTMVPRAIDDVVDPLIMAREEETDPVQHYEWLLASDIEKRLKGLFNLAVEANNHCVDMLTSLDGYSPEELPPTNNI